MTSIRCPICEQRLTSADGEGLSAQLRDHISDQHDIDVQKKGAGFTAPMTTAQESPSGRMIETTVNRPSRGLRGAEHRREEQFWAPEEGTPIPPRPKGVSNWMRKALGTNEEAGGREEWAHGEGYPAMMERAANRSTAPGHQLTGPIGGAGDVIACPMCGRTVMGSNEPELSHALEDHFRTEHHIVSHITTR